MGFRFLNIFSWLLVSLIFSSGCAGSAPSMKGEDPLGEFSENLNALHFLDSREGWAVGDNGSLLHTFNGGATWERKDTGSTRNLNDIFFVDPNNGWIVGEGGIILRTFSAGLSWERQDHDSTENLNGVYFLNVNQGWAVGDKGTILFTTDGGLLWTLEPGVGEGDLNDVFFRNVNSGWMVGDEGLVLYTDAGMRGGFWVSQISGTTHDLRSIYWNGANAFAVGDGGTIIKSATQGPGGQGFWVSLPPTLIGGTLWHVGFINSSMGWVAGDDGAVFYTDDGGLTWLDRSPRNGASLRAVHFRNENIGWAVGKGGSIYHTVDGGVFWISQRVR